MKLDKCIQIFVATTLVLPIAAFSQAGANPFGPSPKTTTAIADMTKAEALANLTSSDRAKVHPDHLTKLLDRAPNKVETKADLVIVEYAQNLITGLPSNKKISSKEIDNNQKRNTAEFKKIKQNTHGKFAAYELEIVQDYERLPFSVVSIKNKRGLNKLLKDVNVKAIHINNSYKSALQQSLPQIGQPVAAVNNFTGAGTSVVIIDSGVDYTRAAFGYCSSPGVPANTCKVIASFDKTNNDGDLDNFNYHGTHVAGIVAGVAPGAKIIMIDTAHSYTSNFFGEHRHWDEDIISGIDWAIANKFTYNIKAINMSLGGSDARSIYPWTEPYLYSTALLVARNYGILPIVSAGNESNQNGLGYLAMANGAISVGSVDKFDNVAPYSNSSPYLTLLAPGSRILSAGFELSGTSMAAPHVAGAVAVLSAAFPNESAEEILVRITNSGVPVYDPRNGITKPRLNLRTALGTLIPPTTPPTNPPLVTPNDLDITPILDILLLSN